MQRKIVETIVITALLLLMTFTTMALPAQAQTVTNQQEGGSIPGPIPSGVTPTRIEPTRAFLSFTPNPIGVGQSLLVNMWLNPALHVSRYHKDYTVTLTKPDGTTEVVKKNSYRADATAWFEYIPDQAGEWTIKFDFLGSYFPPGNYTVYPGAATVAVGFTSFNGSVYYEPSHTAEQKLTVLENYIYSWPPAPLPTDYWTRPASLLNREWWPILGNFPGTGYEGGGPMWDALYPNTNPAWSARYNFHPWVIAPNTAHVVWKRQSAIGGLIGGSAGQLGTTGSPGGPDVIYSGRCYETYYKAGVGNVAACYDLRTGEIYYEIPTASGGVTPSYLAYQKGTRSEVPGAEATQTYSVELISISGNYLLKVNPATGAVTNISIAVTPSLSGTTYYRDNCAVSIQNMGTSVPAAQRYRLINWSTIGSSTNFTSRIVSNTTYARSSLPAYIDWNAGYGATQTSIRDEITTGIYEGMQLEGIDLWTGASLWNVTIGEPRYSDSCHIADHGKIAVLSQEGHWLAYDLATGKQVWVSEQMDYPWDAASFGAYAVASAYGKLIRFGYGGVYAFDWDTGKIVWKYTAPALAAFESPYLAEEGGEMVYPFNTGGMIADGKLYTRNTEHTASWPRTRGWSIHCINVTTGEGLWRLGGEITPEAIADGYLATSNAWDGYMYVFGKGKTSTTVSAPDVGVAKGTSIVIKGTVLDMSPAQPNTPCVSKDSMTLQMEYLHMQQPIGGIWNNETIVGVPVVLTALGADGSVIDLGTVTTDGYYGTFSKTWTPDKEGDYKIIVSFAGDDSYGKSAASTTVAVVPAAQISIPEQIAPPDYTMTIVYGVIAMIIAVVISIAIAVMILRKR